MSVLSATDPIRLSHEQERFLGPYREHWKLVRNSTALADRPEAERGVELAYAAAGLPAPERIVWCQSPIGIERSRKSTWHQFDPGPNLKSLVVNGVIGRAVSSVEDNVPVRVRVAASTGLEIDSHYFGASGALSNALAEEAARIGWSAAACSSAIFARLTRKHFTPYVSFDESRWLQHETLSTLAKCAYLHNVCGAVGETAALRGLWKIATSAGAMIPHQRVCWLSERHDTLALDINGRLHCKTGPAIRYPDGWSLYSWKGVAVPRWMIENPEQITTWKIERESNPILRHCMIDIMTPERYIATGAVDQIATDNVGILWRKQWGDWWNAWAAVQVVNGTPEPDGTNKHYFLQVPTEMRTPTEAVAWTYGMSAERYATLNHRT